MERKSHIFRFDDVEVREGEFSLTKAGKVSTVEPKAFHALLFLLRNPQRLISTEELIQWVWGDTAVGDGSLTRCIWLLRRLLGDDSNEPRYIETVTTVGYRFVCPVEATIVSAAAAHARIQSPETEVRVSPEAPRPAEPDVSKRPARPGRHLGFALAAAGIVVACAALLAAWWFAPRSVPIVESVTQLTENPGPKFNLVTGGSRVYFNEGLNSSISQASIAQVSIEGGPSVPLQTALSNPFIAGIARDEKRFIEHSIGIREITGLTLTTPVPLRSAVSQRIVEDGILSTRTGATSLLEVEFDNNRREKSLDFRPQLPLIFQL